MANKIQSSVDSESAGRSADHERQGQGIDPEGIFDERIALFTQHFQGLCEKEEVQTAIVIVTDPKINGGPLLWKTGGNYEVAKLLATVLRRLKLHIFNELDV